MNTPDNNADSAPIRYVTTVKTKIPGVRKVVGTHKGADVMLNAVFNGEHDNTFQAHEVIPGTDPDLLLAIGALVLPLPERAAGCKPCHAPLLEAARRLLGDGLPLDCLPKDEEDFYTWEIIEDDPADNVIAVRVYAERIDDEGTLAWACDKSVTDDGDDFPKGFDAWDEVIDVADNDADPNDEGNDDGDDHYLSPYYVALTDDGDVIEVFTDEDEAAEAVVEARREGRYGWPWAWGWAYYLNDPTPTDISDLQACGFTVARHHTGAIFAGIDGGGYDFASAHRAPLGARLLARWHRTVKAEDKDGNTYDVVSVGPPLR